MGQGVVDPLGGSAWRKWEIRVVLVGPRVQAAARGLLTGEPVLSADDAVVIRWTAAQGARGTLRVRDVDLSQRYVLDSTVHAFSQQEIAALPVAEPAGVAASMRPGATAAEAAEAKRMRLFSTGLLLLCGLSMLRSTGCW